MKREGSAGRDCRRIDAPQGVQTVIERGTPTGPIECHRPA